MNYVVASLLLGRIPECYTNITSIDAVAGDSTPIPENEESTTTTGGSGDTGSGEPALAIVQAVVTETMPGTYNTYYILYYILTTLPYPTLTIIYYPTLTIIFSTLHCTILTIIYYYPTLYYCTIESLMDEAEVDVYLLMRELLQPNSKLDMAGMWKERIPKLKLRIYQLDRYR